MEIINVIPSSKDVLYLKLNNFKLFGREFNFRKTKLFPTIRSIKHYNSEVIRVIGASLLFFYIQLANFLPNEFITLHLMFYQGDLSGGARTLIS